MLSNSSKLILITILFALSVSLQIVSFAQDKELTFDQVYMFAPPRILNSLPSLKGWQDEDHYLELKRTREGSQLLTVNAVTGEEKIFIDYAGINNNLPEDFDALSNEDVTEDYDQFLFSKDDDLYYHSVSKNEFKQLTDDETPEMNPEFSPDGKKVAYTKNRDLYVIDVETGIETRLTNDASDVVYNGWSSWVYMEEILGRSTKHKAYWWAPNSRMIAFLHTDDSPVPKFPLFNSSGVHGELEWEHYPKPGDPNPLVKLGVVHLDSKEIVWIEEDEKKDQYTAFPFWTKNSKQLFYQVVNRGQDTIQILSADPETGKNELIYKETQPTWIEFFEDIYLFEDESGFVLISDKDGWRHLYYYDMKGNLISQLTRGTLSVDEIKYVDEENDRVFIEGFDEHSTQTHLFVVNLNGSDLKQLTEIEGVHNTNVSTNGKYFYDTYSSINTPAKLAVYNDEGEEVRFIADRKSEVYDQYNLGKTELFTITTEDGIALPAKWTLPPDFDPSKKYPILLDVYGGPGRADVKNSYSAYLSRFFLAQSGIIHFVVDHRGSSHFGQKGKEYLHRNLGKWEMNDYIEAVRWLKDQDFIDTSKIGITGGSYGGFVTALALTYGADYFTHGYAEYSVTDYRLYDNVYTERFMDLPSENPEGYDFTSAMNHAENYKGLLRITHGTMDDNVHMQNTMQLVDKLTNLNKHFELMLYPNSGHGVGWPKWTHAQTEYVNFWYKNLLGKDFKRD